MKVKILSEYNPGRLENSINKWIKEASPESILSVTQSCNPSGCITAIILYKPDPYIDCYSKKEDDDV